MQGWWKFSTRDAGFCQAALTVLSTGVALRDQPGLVLAAVPWPRGELGNGDVLAALMGLSCQRLQSVNKHSLQISCSVRLENRRWAFTFSPLHSVFSVWCR